MLAMKTLILFYQLFCFQIQAITGFPLEFPTFEPKFYQTRTRNEKFWGKKSGGCADSDIKNTGEAYISNYAV